TQPSTSDCRISMLPAECARRTGHTIRLTCRAVLRGRGCTKSSSCKEQFVDNAGNLHCKKRRNCISDLLILLGAVTREDVTVRKGLQTSCLPDRQTSALCRVVMSVVMAVLADVGGNSR